MDAHQIGHRVKNVVAANFPAGDRHHRLHLVKVSLAICAIHPHERRDIELVLGIGGGTMRMSILMIIIRISESTDFDARSWRCTRGRRDGDGPNSSQFNTTDALLLLYLMSADVIHRTTPV
jgi:hypothetical protein